MDPLYLDYLNLLRPKGKWTKQSLYRCGFSSSFVYVVLNSFIVPCYFVSKVIRWTEFVVDSGRLYLMSLILQIYFNGYNIKRNVIFFFIYQNFGKEGVIIQIERFVIFTCIFIYIYYHYLDIILNHINIFLSVCRVIIFNLVSLLIVYLI